MVEVRQHITTDIDRSWFDLPFDSPEIDLGPPPAREWPGAVPPSIDDMTPGPAMAAFLSTVDPSTLSGHDRVSLLRAHQRLVSHFQARMYRDMNAVRELLQSESDPTPQLDTALAAEAEIRAALVWSRRRTENELSFAIDLEARHPLVLASLENGSIDVQRAKAIEAGTSHLPESAARSIGETLLAEANGLTVGQIQARARSLAMSAQPDEARSRYERAHDARRVVMEPSTDGTAHITAMDIAPDSAASVTRRISRLARQARSANDTRTPDQIRADVFVDLLLGRAGGAGGPGGTNSSGGPTADVELRVDLTTLMGLDEKPAQVSGFGPVISEVARKLAGDPGARWRATVTDSNNGRPLGSETIRRRPSASQVRNVRRQQPTCVFPGCRATASDCDLDHTKPWASGGETTEANLAPLCRHDHRIKSEAGWSYSQTPEGDVIWWSALGHRYVRPRPPP